MSRLRLQPGRAQRERFAADSLRDDFREALTRHALRVQALEGRVEAHVASTPRTLWRRLRWLALGR